VRGSGNCADGPDGPGPVQTGWTGLTPFELRNRNVS